MLRLRTYLHAWLLAIVPLASMHSMHSQYYQLVLYQYYVCILCIYIYPYQSIDTIHTGQQYACVLLLQYGGYQSREQQYYQLVATVLPLLASSTTNLVHSSPTNSLEYAYQSTLILLQLEQYAYSQYQLVLQQDYLYLPNTSQYCSTRVRSRTLRLTLYA